MLALDSSLLALSLLVGLLDVLPALPVLLGLGGLGMVGVTAGGLALLALLAGNGGKKKKKKKVDDGPISNCPPLPALPYDELAALVAQGAAEGVVGLMAFVSYVARMLYPNKSDGTPISWPDKAPFVLRQGTAGELICRWEEIKRALGELDPPIPEIDTPTIADILSDLVITYPLPGHFYQIKAGDTLDGIARQALNNLAAGSGQAHSDRLAYIKNCINVGTRWNALYSSTSSSNAFPAYYLTNGKGLRRAFYPWHPAALSILGGKMPKRAITPAGAKVNGLGNAYGMLWLPPVDENALTQFGEVVCGGKWDDGSPMTDPPPELLSQLEGS